MSASQNGWRVLSSNQVTWFSAAGGRFAAADANVAAVAGELIRRFHAEVEPITGRVLDDWSYAVRNVRGSSTAISNHSSATAWDLNATQHPRGSHNTFRRAEVTAIRKILRALTDDTGDRVIRWGGDFSTTVDEMHFEVNAGPRSMRQAAQKIRAKQAAKAEEDEMKDSDFTRIGKLIDARVDAAVAQLKQELPADVWNSDRIPVVDPVTGKPDATNPNWQADSVLSALLAEVRALRAEVNAAPKV